MTRLLVILDQGYQPLNTKGELTHNGCVHYSMESVNKAIEKWSLANPITAAKSTFTVFGEQAKINIGLSVNLITETVKTKAE